MSVDNKPIFVILSGENMIVGEAKRKMRFIVLTFSLMFFLSPKGFAQSEILSCGTESPCFVWENEFQKLISKSISENHQYKISTNNYIIPVIFHIVHGGEPIGTFPNILQGQLSSQMDVLNQDFSGNSYNASNYPANAFVNWAASQDIPSSDLDQNGRITIADFNIQFCLATTDTNGNLLAEPGIDRINFISKDWPNPNQFGTQSTMKYYLDNIVKPQSIWDVTKYLNVWITDKSNALNHAGVSTVPKLSGLMDLPNTSTESTDGIWCFTKVIGSNQIFPSGNYISQFIDGRTLTHEVGHYLGLRHIWGDAACGNDFCNDTPPAGGQNGGSPSYPHNPGSCSSPSNNPDGEMFMNFMDYTMGPSKYMFTTDQKIRAHTAMQNSPFRNLLGTHDLCSTLSTSNEINYNEKLTAYPNPTFGDINISIGNQIIRSIKITNQFGVLLREVDFMKFSINDFNPGIYFLILQGDKRTYTIKVHKL